MANTPNKKVCKMMSSVFEMTIFNWCSWYVRGTFLDIERVLWSIYIDPPTDNKTCGKLKKCKIIWTTKV